jgi:ribosomal protein S18 acetylase RimI-like enzyme
MPSSEFRRFTPDQAARVASWPCSADEAVKWCGASEFPVPAALVQDWQQDDVRSWLLITDGAPVGYGELWLDAEENEVELARIIVAPTARGRGLGHILVQQLLTEALAVGYAESS